jgi:hypothetical protein
MLSKSHSIIIFIDRLGFSIYQDTLTGIPRFNFTPDIVANLDVIDKEKFTSLIETFIQTNKIISSNFAVVLSDDIIYVKDLSTPPQKSDLDQKQKADANSKTDQEVDQSKKVDQNDEKNHEKDVQDFLEDIPFEEVLAKTIKAVNMNRVVAVNKDLVMSIIDTFVGKGSTAVAIVPSFMFGQNANFTQGLTSNTVHIIIENGEILKLGNMLTNQERINSPQAIGGRISSLPDDKTKKPQNLRQYILIGVFLLLIIILVIVIFTSGILQSPGNNNAKTAPSAQNIAPVVKATLTPPPVATTSADLESISINISRSPQATDRAKSLQTVLTNMGFKDIALEASGTSVPEQSSVIFSEDIPIDIRNNIVEEIKKILPEISILENKDLDATINIIIGKS